MKIAILTYLHVYNYGAETQCYALQRKLRNLGYEVDVLDVYRPVNKEYVRTKSDNSRFKSLYVYKSSNDIESKIKKTILNFYSILYNFFNAKKYKERKLKFIDFEKENINLSVQKYYNFEQLFCSDEINQYTHFIVGSDQVWNYAYPFSIEPYFLTFVKKGKKISYAPSIGHSSIPSSVEIKYKEWLNDFDSISVRESHGVELLSKITNRNDIKHVLDPTFLLTKEEWLANLNIDTNECEHYVLVYLLSKSDFSLKLAVDMSKKLNCRVKVISTKLFNYYLGKDIEFISNASPIDFVEYFSKAKFVVTNSFHGTAFSVNFNIPFVSTTRNNKRVNSRFISLLNKSSLIDRLIYENDLYDLDKILTCDFTDANLYINKERDNSINYLLESLK